MVRTITTLLLVLSSSLAFAQADSSDVFKRRILPLLQSPDQSSCQECHVAGIGIATFLKDSEAATFASLLSSGWIDTESPEKSKLLTFVNRHTDETTADIQRLREREFKALTSWITAASKNQELLSLATNASAGIELDEELIRHLRKDRVVSRFLDSIWADIGRCVNCHSPDRNQKFVKEHGEQMSWVVPNDPARTLNYLLDHDLIDALLIYSLHQALQCWTLQGAA